eukprot:TRINITY_DN12957_c0_g1_i2.p1 TRINITY_DN12957_c0_g1~~TRINITY_DN12957_c0_g1_i2.p1  ORF type:complete len:210 (-),score=34.84 TRINITY_DN12957_c0_g1_i2:254-883(-)
MARQLSWRAGLRLPSVIVCVAWALSAGSAGGQETADDASSAVVELTDDTFDALIGASDSRTWFVQFYAPWCGHCRRLQPTWESVGARLQQESGGTVRAARLDATSQRVTASRFGVGGFPELLLLTGGEMKRYRGPRDESSLLAWATQGHQQELGEPSPAQLGLLRRGLVYMEAWLDRTVRETPKLFQAIHQAEAGARFFGRSMGRKDFV